jgi:hypothetical protein
LPVGLNSEAVNFAGCAALVRLGAHLDFHEAGVFAFGDKFADFVGANIYYRSKFVRDILWVFYSSRLSENSLDFIACGERSASTINNHAALRFLGYSFLLLPDGNGVIMVASDKL